MGAFVLSSLTPLQAIPIQNVLNVNLKDINFGFRIEKLIEKAKRYFSEKNANKFTEGMWEIKHEIEGYTGQTINIDHCLDRIEREAIARGRPIDSAHMREMRNRFNRHEKRFHQKSVHMAMCLEHDLSYDPEDEIVFFHNDMSFSNDGNDNDGKNEVVLPLRVTIGVTMSLVGLFLYVVPFPICKAAAPWVLETGIAFLIDQGITEWENGQSEKKR